MKRALSLLLLAALFWSTAALASGTNNLPLIPWPQIVRPLDGSFMLTPQTHIYADWSSRKTADFFAQRLRQSTGYPLKVHWRHAGSPPENAILFTTKNADTNLSAEGYCLLISTNSIVIRAPTQAGLFYGGQTLLQLLPPEIFSTNVVTENWQVPSVFIMDWPRFPWRGLMLDVSRHFYNKAEVESVLDTMALYKFNRFHWHLDDDQGWRIQIPKYPLLTREAAWRAQSTVKPPDGQVHAHPGWSNPTLDKFSADGRYGGFYTARDIREVVAYAAARHIMVIPEIEMPGHSEAALRAYPQFSSVQGTNGIDLNWGVYNPSNPETFEFLDTVLARVIKLFPGPYVHIGGDEVNTNYWHDNPGCQALMKSEGLASEHELQSWFTRHMEQYITAHGKALIGWSEILRGGLATNAVVMDWTGGGRESAEAGHDVIMAPEAFCYFDHYQSLTQTNEPQARNPVISLHKVYSLEPVPSDLSPQFQSHILGTQGNLWTEYVPSLAHAQYMIFPRACALAEVAWSAKDARDWDDFQRRLAVDAQRLDALGINYHPLPSGK